MRQRLIVAHYGPEDEEYGQRPGLLSPVQVAPFLASLAGRIFPLHVTPIPDERIVCFVVTCGERLPAEDTRYGSILAFGSSAWYSPRELRAMTEGKTPPLISDEERAYDHPDWECRVCHPEKYQPPQHLLGGEQIWYDDGRYGLPMTLCCRVHGSSIHYRISIGEEAEMMMKCAKDCRSRCAGHCRAYRERQERALLAGVYYLPGYGERLQKDGESRREQK